MESLCIQGASISDTHKGTPDVAWCADDRCIWLRADKTDMTERLWLWPLLRSLNGVRSLTLQRVTHVDSIFSTGTVLKHALFAGFVRMFPGGHIYRIFIQVGSAHLLSSLYGAFYGLLTGCELRYGSGYASLYMHCDTPCTLERCGRDRGLGRTGSRMRANEIHVLWDLAGGLVSAGSYAVDSGRWAAPPS